MKVRLFLNLSLAISAVVLVCHVSAQNQMPPLPSYLMPNYDEAGRKLPPGVPREVDTNGVVVYVNHRFTTPAYQKEALKLVIQEANQVAQELKLPEELPITKSNLVEYHISPFGFAYAYKTVGSVTTENYIYYVSLNDKLSYLEGTHQLEDCKKYLAEGYSWPVSKIDTNAAYQLATQWLSNMNMDVTRLNSDCRVSTAVDSVYAQAPPGKFIPTYWISWIPTNGESLCAADVRLFLPTKTLLQLRVEDPKYILRKPVEFTNMAALFPGNAPVHTNYPAKTIIITKPLWGS